MSQSESYDNTHRAFLQALIARPTLTFAEAQPLLALIQTSHNPDRPVLEGDITRADFDQYVHAVNNAISSFDMEIRSTAHQSNRGVEVFALVNTASDALTQMATVHSADEIAFVKRVLDCMFETNNTRKREVMAVTSWQALKLTKVPDSDRRESGAATQQDTQTQNAGITMQQAERVLRLLVSESWFECSDKDFYTLSPRALMELRGWLIDTYNDGDNDSDSDHGHPHEKIKVCMACRRLLHRASDAQILRSDVLRGYTCIAWERCGVHKEAERSVPVARKNGRSLCQWERRLQSVRGKAEAWAGGDRAFRVWMEQTKATDGWRLVDFDSALFLLSIILARRLVFVHMRCTDMESLLVVTALHECTRCTKVLTRNSSF